MNNLHSTRLATMRILKPSALVWIMLALSACSATTSNASDEWRFLGDASKSSDSYDFHTELDESEDEFVELLEELGFEGDAPEVDFSSELVLTFAIWHGSGCRPDFAGVTVDHVSGEIDPIYEDTVDPGQACPSNVVGFANMVAFDRTKLTNSEYRVHLGFTADDYFVFMP